MKVEIIKGIEKIKDKIKLKNIKYIEEIILIILLVAIAIMIGINRTKLSDFTPTNGDFQNYNPIRRFLSGQIPYKDFAVYLGSGHLLLLSFFCFIVGNNFTKSLFVTNMVTTLCFEVMCFVIFALCLKDKKKALYCTLGLTIINVLKPKFIGSKIGNGIINALNLGISVGNSARLIRMAIIPILGIFIYLGFKLIDKSQIKFISNKKETKKKAYMAVIAGGAILWSNDGGIASYIAISLVSCSNVNTFNHIYNQNV